MAEKVISTSKFGEFWLQPHDIDLFQTFQTLFQSFMFQTVSVRIHLSALSLLKYIYPLLGATP